MKHYVLALGMFTGAAHALTPAELLAVMDKKDLLSARGVAIGYVQAVADEAIELGEVCPRGASLREMVEHVHDYLRTGPGLSLPVPAHRVVWGALLDKWKC